MKPTGIDVVWTTALFVIVALCVCAMMSRSCESPILGG